MKVLLTGGRGQVGRELLRACPDGCRITAPASSELDITNRGLTGEFVAALSPDVIINAAGYTAVDRAESEPERAFAVNAVGAACMAEAASDAGARLIHMSTDFVFDGKKSSPYLPDDPAVPLSVYGASKLRGEEKVMAIMGNNALVIRTSWVYSAFEQNFVKTMLELMAKKTMLRVVADQAGTPTWAKGLAEIIWKAVLNPVYGTFHWSDSGIASWYDFACAIFIQAVSLGILSGYTEIVPVSTAEYPTPARRPAYSVLDKKAITEVLGITPPHWQTNLCRMLEEYRESVL